jgi:hypothetical protein
LVYWFFCVLILSDDILTSWSHWSAHEMKTEALWTIVGWTNLPTTVVELMMWFVSCISLKQ